MTVPNSILSLSLIASAALVILGRTCSCLQFTYPSFDAGHEDDFIFSPGSAVADGSLQITPTAGDMSHRSGRVVYARETLKLSSAGFSSFRTEFVLNILPVQNGSGEGMAFILTNNPSLPSNSSGQWLGVCNDQKDGAETNRIVAVEFDTSKSFEGDDLDGNHVDATDVYAFGVFVMEVVTGRSPSRPVHDAVLAGAYDEEQIDCTVRLALACCHPNPSERPSMRTAVQVLIGGAPAPDPPLEKPAFVWPPSGKRQEIELPHFGVLFTGGQLNLTSTSITGR